MNVSRETIGYSAIAVGLAIYWIGGAVLFGSWWFVVSAVLLLLLVAHDGWTRRRLTTRARAKRSQDLEDRIADRMIRAADPQLARALGIPGVEALPLPDVEWPELHYDEEAQAWRTVPMPRRGLEERPKHGPETMWGPRKGVALKKEPPPAWTIEDHRKALGELQGDAANPLVRQLQQESRMRRALQEQAFMIAHPGRALEGGLTNRPGDIIPFRGPGTFELRAIRDRESTLRHVELTAKARREEDERAFIADLAYLVRAGELSPVEAGERLREWHNEPPPPDPRDRAKQGSLDRIHRLVLADVLTPAEAAKYVAAIEDKYA